MHLLLPYRAYQKVLIQILLPDCVEECASELCRRLLAGEGVIRNQNMCWHTVLHLTHASSLAIDWEYTIVNHTQ